MRGFLDCRLRTTFVVSTPRGKTILLDNHPIFGGEAKRNEFEVDGVHLTGPQGSNDFAVQRETGEPDDYFTALNIPRDFEFREPEGAAEGMRIPFDNYDYAVWHSFDVVIFFVVQTIPG